MERGFRQRSTAPGPRRRPSSRLSHHSPSSHPSPSPWPPSETSYSPPYTASYRPNPPYLKQRCPPLLRRELPLPPRPFPLAIFLSSKVTKPEQHTSLGNLLELLDRRGVLLPSLKLDIRSSRPLLANGHGRFVRGYLPSTLTSIILQVEFDEVDSFLPSFRTVVATSPTLRSVQMSLSKCGGFILSSKWITWEGLVPSLVSAGDDVDRLARFPVSKIEFGVQRSRGVTRLFLSPSEGGLAVSSEHLAVFRSSMPRLESFEIDDYAWPEVSWTDWVSLSIDLPYF